MSWDSMITVGRIVRPHGHRGAVVVEPESDFASERFEKGAAIQFLSDGQLREIRILDSREFRGRWILTLEGVSSMNDAEALRGSELRIAADDVKTLGPGAHYVYDLVGCRIETVDGRIVGTVTDVLFNTGIPTLVAAGTSGEEVSGGEVLVPLVDEICRIVDPAGKRIVIDPPEGLVELNLPSRSARR